MVQVVDEDILYTGLGEVMLSIHGDELATDALELREGYGRRWKADGFLNTGNCYFATALAFMVFLIG